MIQLRTESRTMVGSLMMTVPLVDEAQVPTGHRRDALAIPPGQAVNMPSIRTDAQLKRGNYGGKGDKAHLGGFTELDLHGISPALWKHMVESLGVHSVLDVGCNFDVLVCAAWSSRPVCGRLA